MIRQRKPIARSTKPIRKRRRSKKTSLRWTTTLDGAVRVYPNGREVCQSTEAGRLEYKARLQNMLFRQGHVCCICGRVDHALGGPFTFEHSDLRGMGAARRDDRIEIDGKPVNGAAHFWCNAVKGSQRIKTF